jgi:hypothetical protein
MRGGLVEAKHALWASWDVGWRDLRRYSIAIGATGHGATSYRKIGLGMAGGCLSGLREGVCPSEGADTRTHSCVENVQKRRGVCQLGCHFLFDFKFHAIYFSFFSFS